MTRDDRPDLEAWTSQLTEPFRGRPVIVAFHVLAGMTSHVARLEEWGAERPLLVARGIGTGPLPSPDDADIYQLPLDAARPAARTAAPQGVAVRRSTLGSRLRRTGGCAGRPLGRTADLLWLDKLTGPNG